MKVTTCTISLTLDPDFSAMGFNGHFAEGKAQTAGAHLDAHFSQFDLFKFVKNFIVILGSQPLPAIFEVEEKIFLIRLETNGAIYFSACRGIPYGIAGTISWLVTPTAACAVSLTESRPLA